jgi:hypothetical protein
MCKNAGHRHRKGAQGDRRTKIRGGQAGVLAGSERRGAQLGDAGPHRLDHLAGHTRPHRHNVDRPLERVEIAGAAIGQRHDDGVRRFGVRVDRLHQRLPSGAVDAEPFFHGLPLRQGPGRKPAGWHYIAQELGPIVLNALKPSNVRTAGFGKPTSPALKIMNLVLDYLGVATPPEAIVEAMRRRPKCRKKEGGEIAPAKFQTSPPR